ncbi:MAG: hypothetical protein LQ341_007792 [Variospora aurantia]|nr:MAG: hypothetical protein LQ341_007792 [Variospora aurantia]
MQGSFWGKYAGLFVATAGLGGGQESTCIAAMSTLAHHGMIYVPLGYKTTFGQLTNLEEVHGGSAWGAGTFAGSDGARQPTPLEIEVATAQGKAFYEAVAKAHDGGEDATAAPPPPQQQQQPSSNATAARSGAAAGKAQSSDVDPSQMERKESGGPCGLPNKCEIL